MKNIMVIYQLLKIVGTAEKETNDTIIARAFLENRDVLSNLSLDRIAEKYYVSQASVSRFIHKLGFQNYNEFRESCTLSECRMKAFHPDQRQPFSQIQNDVYEKIQKTVEDIHELDGKTVVKIVQQLEEKNHIIFFGSELSTCILQLVQNKLVSKGKCVYALQNLSFQKEYLKFMQEDDYLICISIDDRWIAGLDIEQLQKTKCLKQLWTVQQNSQYEQYFDDVFHFGNYIDENMGYHQLMQTMQIL